MKQNRIKFASRSRASIWTNKSNNPLPLFRNYYERIMRKTEMQLKIPHRKGNLHHYSKLFARDSYQHTTLRYVT